MRPAQRGFELFTGKASCVSCHTIGPEQALFTNHQMHNTGIGYAREYGSRTRINQSTTGTGCVC